MELRLMFLLFIIFSFLGWTVEVLYTIFVLRKFSNRGFLIGPICPIYGVGALLMILLLKKYYDDILALFIMSTILGAILEYITSYILEKIFKIRWWDYNNKKFNINGRICLEASIIFGFLGVITVRFIYPLFRDVLLLLPNTALLILSIILFIMFITDFIISCNVLVKIKKADLSGIGDATNEITNRVRAALAHESILTKRLTGAFPNLKTALTNLKSLKKYRK